jgi:hypothetical protein
MKARTVVLLLRGVSKGETSRKLASELNLSYPTVLKVRHALQGNAAAAQAQTPLSDSQTETDEMFLATRQFQRK